MKVRALQSCQVDNTYRRGPELNDKEEVLAEGEVFHVPDDYPINPEVLEVLEPPANGKPHIIELPHELEAAAASGEGEAGKSKGKGKK